MIHKVDDDWLTDWLIDCLIDWLIDYSIMIIQRVSGIYGPIGLLLIYLVIITVIINSLRASATFMCS